MRRRSHKWIFLHRKVFEQMKVDWIKKISVLIALLVAGGSLLLIESHYSTAEVPSEKKQQITFAWWGSEVRQEKYIQAIELFEQQHPEIDVRYQFSPWEEYWQQLAAKAGSGELPDVFQMGDNYLAQYTQRNLLADLSRSVYQKELDSSAYDEKTLAAGVVQGRQTAFPATVNVMALLTRKDRWQQSAAPDFSSMTATDFFTFLAETADSEGCYPYSDVADNYVLLQYYLRSKGEALWQKDRSGKLVPGFTQEAFTSFLAEMRLLVATGKMPPAEVMSAVRSFDESPLARGEAASMLTWSNQLETYELAEGPGTVLEIQLPYASKSKGLALHVSTYFSIAKNSRQPQAAAQLVDFLVNDPAANRLLGIERGLPANPQVVAAIYPDLPASGKKVADYMQSAAPYVKETLPVPPVGAAVLYHYFKELFAQTTFGRMSPEDAYAAYLAKWQEIEAQEELLHAID